MSSPRIAEPATAHLPLVERWFPMGHALEIASNSPEAMSAAKGLWRDYRQLSDAAPVRLRIEVAEDDALTRPRPLTPGHFGYLMTIAQCPRNFAVADTRSGEGVIRITRDVVRDTRWFAYHFLEPVSYVLLCAKHFTMIHAASVALEGKAALLCGGAGAGKTCLAYACARRGWSFVSGDATHLVRHASEPAIIGRPFSIRFRASAKTLFQELQPYPARMRPNGKRDLELNTRRLRLRTAVEARACATVFVDFMGELPAAHLETVSRDDARNQLGDSIRYGDAANRREQQQALERLLDLPAFRLRYSDLAGAERLLRRLVAGAV